MTGPLLTRAAAVAQVLVDDLDEPVLSSDDVLHVERVLRARRGETVIVTDGRGGWRSCVWSGQGKVEAVGPVEVEERPGPAVTIAFALLKGDRSEWVVQKLTELGVDRIVPLSAERIVVRWDEKKAERNSERFRRVAHEAAMQSRRVWLPVVEPPATVASIAAAGAALAVPGGGAPPGPDHPFVAVGPEGGWAPSEVESAAATVDLGPTILRAETAAVAAGVLLCAARWQSARGA